MNCGEASPEGPTLIVNRANRRSYRSGGGVAGFIVLVAALLVLAAKLVTAAAGTGEVVNRPLERLTTAAVYSVDRVGRGLLSILEVFRLPAHLRRLNELEGELALLRTANEQLQEEVRENERLRALLKLNRSPGFDPVTAEVVCRSMDLWFDAVIINRGASAGIRLQDLVVNGDGLVGEVAEVDAHYAKVRLVTSPDFALAAVSHSSRLDGVIRGTGVGRMTLGYVAADAPLKLQERLFTAGLSITRDGRSRPRGLLIGFVANIKKSDLSTLQVSVRPAVRPGRLRTVLVLTERAK